jgi:hypothetical protein
MYETSKMQQYDYFSTLCFLITLITGVIRSYLLKPGKIEDDPIHSIWSHMLQLKFVLSLLLTPLIYPLTCFFAEEDE